MYVCVVTAIGIPTAALKPEHNYTYTHERRVGRRRARVRHSAVGCVAVCLRTLVVN